MTPGQALNELDQLVQQCQGTRADHVRWQTAVQILARAIAPAPPAPEKAEKKPKTKDK